MKRIFIAGYLVLQTSVVLSADQIDVQWTSGDCHFTLRNVDYNEEEVSAYNEICSNFHKADTQAREADRLARGMSVEEYRDFASGIIESRTTSFKEGVASQILIHKNNQLVGGSYYWMESTTEDGKYLRMKTGGEIVRMTCGGFKTQEIIPTDLMQIYATIMDALSSKATFPTANRLIVCISKESIYIPILKDVLGFRDSSYPVEDELSPEIYCTFERDVKTKEEGRQ